jgi:predicted porin
MKKSLLAVAVAAALPAFAQAQSSVTLYGLVDAAIEYSNANANGIGTGPAALQGGGQAGLRLINGGQTGSRFGIRGVEDLGGGLKAVFTLEHRLSVDTGDTGGGNPFVVAGQAVSGVNNKFWNGQAFVGLQGGWGQLTMGRQYTPIFWAILPNDFSGYLFYNNWAGFTSNVSSANAVQGPIRLDNSIAYRSPTFGGLTVYATYAFGENLGPLTAAYPNNSDITGTGDIYGLAAGWRLGGLYIGGGYHAFDGKAAAVTGTGFVNVAQAYRSVAVLTAGYRFANFGLSVGYSEIELAQIAAGNATVSTLFGSAFLNLGPGTVYVNAAMVDGSDIVGGRNDSGLQLGVSYLMPMSKRTSFYVTWGQNDFSGLQQNTATTYLLDSQTRVAVGLRHNF